MEKELKMLYNVKDIFLELNKNISNFNNESEFFYEIQKKLRKIFKQSSHSSVLKVSNDGYIKIFISDGYSKSYGGDFHMKFSDSFIYKDSEGDFSSARIINQIDKIKCRNLKNEKEVLTDSGEKIRSSLSIPIYIREELEWIICLDSTDNNVYSDLDILIGDYISEELPIIWNLYDLNLKTLYFSRYDGLTGVMNRRFFEMMFENCLNDERYSSRDITYVLFDLDGLKKVNDAYGHLAGDLYIKKFVEFLNNKVRNAQYFGRIGGDEFALIFIEKDYYELKKDLWKIRNEFSKIKINFEENYFYGRFSYGISLFPRDGDNKSQIMKIADMNMYKDKNRNRG